MKNKVWLYAKNKKAVSYLKFKNIEAKRLMKVTVTNQTSLGLTLDYVYIFHAVKYSFYYIGVRIGRAKVVLTNYLWQLPLAIMIYPLEHLWINKRYYKTQIKQILNLNKNESKSRG